MQHHRRRTTSAAWATAMVATAVFWCAVGAAWASTLDAGAQPTMQRMANPRLISEKSGFKPGATTTIGISFDISPQWHLYWKGQSDTGLPIDVETVLPDGFTAGELQWPAPARYVMPGDLLDYIYEQQVTLLLPVTAPADARPGDEATVTIKLEWLVCKEACIPEDAEVSITLPVQESLTKVDSPETLRRFARARERIPRPLPDPSPVDFTWRGRTLVIAADHPHPIAFYPDQGCARIADPIAQGTSKQGPLRLEFTPPSGAPVPVRGVLELHGPEGEASTLYEIELSGPEPE